MSEQGADGRPESIGGVLGVGFALLLLTVSGLSALGQRTASLDADALYAGWFEAGELPFGLVPGEAARQPGGETLLRLADPSAAPEQPKPEAPKPAGGARPGSRPRFDWNAIPIGPAGSPPREALLATWPLPVARKKVPALFGAGSASGETSLRERSRGVDPLAGLGAEGGRRTLDSGRLPWGEFEVPFVLERTFEPGGAFVDSLRVNLSTESEALVLFLRWSRGLPASAERAAELLEHLRRVSS